MGAGCIYTNLNGTKAAWIDIGASNGDDEEFAQDNYDNLKTDIEDILKSLGYYIDTPGKIRNGLFEIKLESTYYDEGIIIYIEPACAKYSSWDGNKDPRYRLALANHHRAERRIWRALQNAGYELSIATSGYTSKVLEKIE